MNEHQPKNLQENPHQLDLNRSFQDLFPFLTQSFDLSFVKDVKVTENFFPPSKFRNVMEQKFIFFLVQNSLPAESSLVEQQEKATEIAAELKQLELKVSVTSQNPGFSLVKNASLFSVFDKAGLGPILPEEFGVEAASYELLLKQVEDQLAEKMDQALAHKITRQLIMNDLALTPGEVLEIATSGPKVAHFSEAFGSSVPEAEMISDAAVQAFITSNFPVEMNNIQTRIARVTGSNSFLFLNKELWVAEQLSEAEYKKKIEEMGVDEVYKLTLLSFVTSTDSWIDISLFNLCQSIPEMDNKMLGSLDYLEANLPRTEKLKRYALGLMAHEFLHKLQTAEIMGKYKEVAKETWNQTDKVWNGYPSEYVMFYMTEYKSEEELILREDMADSVLIYTVNSAYLKQHYPSRFDFIGEHFPHLIADSAQDQ